MNDTGLTKREGLVRAGLILTSLLVALLIAETALQFAGRDDTVAKRSLHHPGRSYFFHCYPSNPHGELGPPPEVEGQDWHLFTMDDPPRELSIDLIHQTPHCTRYQMNRLGLRDREVSPAPAPGAVRLAVVGDSFAYGEGVATDQMLSRHLQAALGPKVEVINAAQPGLDAQAQTKWFPETVNNLQANRALFVFLLNDITLSDGLKQQQDRINDLVNVRHDLLDSELAESWWSKLALPRLVASAWAMSSVRSSTIEWYRAMYDPSVNGPNLERLQLDLQKISHSNPRKKAFIIYPLIERQGGEYPFTEVHRRVAEMAREAGFPVLDLTPAFDDVEVADLHVHPVDHHPNGRAHEIAAREIATWLARLPGFLP